MNTCMTCGEQYEWIPGIGSTTAIKCARCAQQQGIQRSIDRQEDAARAARERRAAAERSERRAREARAESEAKRAAFQTRSCPICAETIKKRAKKCHYCHEFLSDYESVVAELDRYESEASRLGVEPWNVDAEHQRHAAKVHAERQRRVALCQKWGCTDEQLDGLQERQRVILERERAEQRVAEGRWGILIINCLVFLGIAFIFLGIFYHIPRWFCCAARSLIHKLSHTCAQGRRPVHPTIRRLPERERWLAPHLRRYEQRQRRVLGKERRRSVHSTREHIRKRERGPPTHLWSHRQRQRGVLGQ